MRRTLVQRTRAFSDELAVSEHGGLGIVRSLGRLGVPVYSVDSDWWAPAFSSRYCRGRFVLSIESGPTEESIGRLLEIGEKVGGRPILIPTTDDAAIWVAEHADALQSGYNFPRQDASLVRILCDKGRMRLAREPLPRTTWGNFWQLSGRAS